MRRPGALARSLLVLGFAAWSWAAPQHAPGQPPPGEIPEPTPPPAVDDPEVPRRRLVKWNEFDGPLTTARLGIAFAYDYVGYAQDTESKQQVELHPQGKTRDSRFVIAGRLKLDRPVTWKAGIMYDGANDTWLIRESGVQVAVPELWGHFFIGRTKEGFSLNKVMNGYHGWTPERHVAIDVIPILADGVRWMGYLPGPGVLWNLGWFGDWLSEDQSFSTFDQQIAARVAWLPIRSEADGRLLHLGINGRHGKVDNDELRVRSRPEASPAPYFVDTGKFPASDSRHIGWEAYYVAGPWMVGSEYYLHRVNSAQGGDPLFHGGEVVATWNITGESRGYTTVGGILKTISPAKTVFEGGPGAWEAVLRLSYLDLDDGTLNGGTLWRLTPMANWYLSDNFRLDFTYGYSVLDRYGLEGGTHFFQSRFQFTL